MSNWPAICSTNRRSNKKWRRVFHRNTLTNTEGGTDQEEFRVKATVDRANTTGTVWLGLTVGCGQCHSHKYDPISQREYYSFFAFFNTVKEVNIPAPLPPETERYRLAKAAFDAEHAKLKRAVQEIDQVALDERQAAWETTATELTSWEVLKPTSVKSRRGATLTVEEDGTILASGESPDRDDYTLILETKLTGIKAFRVEVIPDESLPAKGPGRSEKGEFVLSEFEVQASPLSEKEAPDDEKKEAAKPQAVAFLGASADAALKGQGAKRAIDGGTGRGWSAAPGERHVAIFETPRGRPL